MCMTLTDLLLRRGGGDPAAAGGGQPAGVHPRRGLLHHPAAGIRCKHHQLHYRIRISGVIFVDSSKNLCTVQNIWIGY